MRHQNIEVPRCLILVVTWIVAILTAGCGVLAPADRTPPRVHRIGILLDTRREPFEPSIAGLVQGLRDHGYVEGQNLTVEWRFYQDKPHDIPQAAAELIGLPVDVIVAGGTAAAIGANEASDTVPIVAPGFSNPFSMTVRGPQLVTSLAQPGGNVTGMTSEDPELAGKRLQLLVEALGSALPIAVFLSDSAYRGPNATAIQNAAHTLGVPIIWEIVDRPDQLRGAVADASAQGARGALLIEGTDFLIHRAEIVAMLAQYRLPTMSSSLQSTQAGYLMGYGPNHPDMWRRSAAQIDKILKGAEPAVLPVELPTKFDFAINLQTARALGLTFPASTLLQVTEIVQ